MRLWTLGLLEQAFVGASVRPGTKGTSLVLGGRTQNVELQGATLQTKSADISLMPEPIEAVLEFVSVGASLKTGIRGGGLALGFTGACLIPGSIPLPSPSPKQKVSLSMLCCLGLWGG